MKSVSEDKAANPPPDAPPAPADPPPKPVPDPDLLAWLEELL